MFVAVAPDKMCRALDPKHGEDELLALRDVPDFEVVRLEDAIGREYDSDAHMVGYAVRGEARMPRLSKHHPELWPGQVDFWTVMIDVDNPEHALWTPESELQWRVRWDTDPLFASAYIYMTKKGWRYVQPYASPLPIDKAERAINLAMLRLFEAGVLPDRACKDWTRHMRMPHVMRKDGPRMPAYRYRSPYIKRGHPIPPPELEDYEPVELPPSHGRTPRTPPKAFTADVPAALLPLAEAIGAVTKTFASGWHEAYNAVAGTLLNYGVPPEVVPAVVGRAAQVEGSHKPDAHAASARDTVERWARRAPVHSKRYLEDNHPELLATIATFFAPPPSPPPAPTLTADQATAVFRGAIEHAEAGVTVVQVPCGTGKTRTTEDAFVARAARAMQRTPPGGKSVLSVPTHALAVQVQAHLRQRGIPSRRLFSPVRLRDDEGEAVCIHEKRALPLVRGGQSVQALFCPSCEVRATCTARLGEEGEGPVVLGTHARLRDLADEAGLGLLVVDEPPPAMTHEPLTLAQFEHVEAHAKAFKDSYAQRMLIGIRALKHFLAAEKDGEVAELAPFFPGLPALDRGSAPPLRSEYAHLALKNEALAKDVGEASRVFMALWLAAKFDGRVSKDGLRLLVTTPNEGILRACDRLVRDGPTVLLDANADLRMDEVAQVAGYAPRLITAQVSDAGPVQRVLFRCKATRSNWLLHGELVESESLLTAVEQAVRWSLEGPGPVAVIGWKILVEAFKRALAGDAKYPKLQAILEPWRLAMMGHYGALRGLDNMKHAECLVTMGDPWPDMATSMLHGLQLGLDGAEAKERYKAEARAELEQAHGRLRLPRRTTPARAAHFGLLAPSGYGWHGAEVRLVVRPPPLGLQAFRAFVDDSGGQRQAALRIGVDVSTVHRIVHGTRPVTAAIAEKVREAVAAGPWKRLGISG